jgi:hypothetical protein
MGSCNFLLSALGALKEFRNRGDDLSGSLSKWALMAVIVPWERVILRSDLVLQGDLFMPHLPVAAVEVVTVSRQGLTPLEATSLLDALPESAAWLKVQEWERSLRPQLTDGWQGRIQAAEGLAWGLAPLRWMASSYNRSPGGFVHLLQPAEPASGEARRKNQQQLQRFLAILAQELFGDAEREARYRQLWATARMSSEPRGTNDFLVRNPQTGAIEGRFNPWREIETLLCALRDDEVDVWVAAIERAAETLS